MERKFKGFIVLTKAQHKQLLSEGFYIKADGTRVEQDKDYAYVSEDNVDLDELRLQVQENTENLDKKLDKKGGFIEEDLTIMGDLTVKGANFVENAETYTVKENVIVTNSGGQEIGPHLSGLAIKKNQSKAYGIMYDPANDGVKVGLGEVDKDGEFTYDTDENGESEGQFLATREDTIPDKEIPQWNDTAKRFEGSGKKAEDFVERVAEGGRVYATDAQGNATTLPWGFDYQGNQVARRNEQGVLQARMPGDVDSEVQGESWHTLGEAYTLVNARGLENAFLRRKRYFNQAMFSIEESANIMEDGLTHVAVEGYVTCFSVSPNPIESGTDYDRLVALAQNGEVTACGHLVNKGTGKIYPIRLLSYNENNYPASNRLGLGILARTDSGIYKSQTVALLEGGIRSAIFVSTQII